MPEYFEHHNISPVSDGDDEHDAPCPFMDRFLESGGAECILIVKYVTETETVFFYRQAERYPITNISTGHGKKLEASLLNNLFVVNTVLTSRGT